VEILVLHVILLNQNLWEVAQRICIFNKVVGDSYVHRLEKALLKQLNFKKEG
jgi:hypothetical protein